MRTSPLALAVFAFVTASLDARAQTAPTEPQPAAGAAESASPPAQPAPPDATQTQATPTSPATGIAYPPEDELIDTRMRRSWDEGDVRKFVSSQIDIGWVYLRPRISVGYGKPFSAWFGLDANPIIAGDGLGAYAGLRLVVPNLNVRIGPRFNLSFNREYLAAKRSYNRLDLDSTAGNPSRELTLEAEVEASVPLGPGQILALASGSYVTGIPSGQLAFEESLRVIVAPPWVWRARGGYVVRFGSQQQHSIGAVADVLDVPKRDDSLTVRVGPVVRIVLSRRVEVRGSFVTTIVSPDHIGLVGGDFTELGFRYRWATE